MEASRDVEAVQAQQTNSIAMETQSGEHGENNGSPKRHSDATRYSLRKLLRRPSIQYSQLRKGRDRSPTDSRPASKPTSVGRCSRGTGAWTWEVASGLVAVACLAAIVILLLSVKDKPVANWAPGITVNALLSVLVTVMKGAMAVIVAECLSQLKWSWFSRERTLKDLEIFDEASRGVWGAATLLLTRRSWFLASWGAFIFLAGFIIGPTIQLTVEFVIREIEIPSQAASVPVCNATHFDIQSDTATHLETFPLDIIGVIYNGLLQTPKSNTLTPSCPSGNCTFPTYQSLGFCNECIDISDKMRFLPSTEDGACPTTVDSTLPLAEWRNMDRPCMVELPEYGLRLDRFGLMNTTFRYLRQDLNTSPDGTLEPPAGVLSAILRNGKDESQPYTYSAVDCSLRLCVKTYEGAVRLGSFHERILSSTWTSTKGGPKRNSSHTFEVQADTCYIDGHRIALPYTEEQYAKCMYNVDAASFGTLVDVLDELSGDASEPFGAPKWSSYGMTALWGLFSTEDWYSPTSGTLQSVDKAMTSMAHALTYLVRSSPSICAGATVQGIPLSNQPYFQVNWIWLVPTVAVLVLCLAFLAAVIFKSWNKTIWKASVYPYLISRPRAGEELTAQEMLHCAEEQAESTRQPVVALVQKACGEMKVTWDAAAIRIRAPGDNISKAG